MFPFGETVQFKAYQEGAEDSHGNPVESWASPVPSDGWGFDPGGSVESYGPGRDMVVTSPRLFRQSRAFLPGRRDRVIVRGREYAVDGDPADWRSPLTGWEPGIVVTLEVVSG